MEYAKRLSDAVRLMKLAGINDRLDYEKWVASYGTHYSRKFRTKEFSHDNEVLVHLRLIKETLPVVFKRSSWTLDDLLTELKTADVSQKGLPFDIDGHRYDLKVLDGHMNFLGIDFVRPS